MKSIKPGRGPSGMSFVGSIAVIIFGIIWTVIAGTMASAVPFGIVKIFPLFGVIFVIVGIIQAAYHYKNATGKDRFSIFDITDSHEEGDPANKWINKAGRYGDENGPVRDDGPRDSGDVFGRDMSSEDDRFRDYRKTSREDAGKGYNYCPYCGNPLGEGFTYCPECGKRLQ